MRPLSVRSASPALHERFTKAEDDSTVFTRGVIAFWFTILLMAGLALVPDDLPDSPVAVHVSAETSGEVRVAAANVYEGSMVRHPADLRDGTDRKAFARRLLGRSAAVPDVVLLQEVLGTARLMARTLNAHPRAARTGARFVRLGATDHRFVTGSCDGRRSGRFSLLRSSAILMNARTVTAVHERGVIRTWGRWDPIAWHRTGRSGYGCTEHPWARVTVKHPGTAARTALVTSVHIAPDGHRLKNRAVRVVRSHLDRLHRNEPGHVVVMGGDLNLNRCRQSLLRGERRSCAIRSGHRSLLDAGYRDAVRDQHLTGPSGVVGVARRIDFVYAKGRVAASWHDRCYRAHFVRRWPCSAARSVFASPVMFRRCEVRHLFHGSPGNGCSPSMFRRYYTDHQLLFAVVR
jgi:hypothetical protein